MINPQKKFLTDCAKRTRVPYDEPVWQSVLGGIAFGVFVLVVMFV